MGYQWQNDIRGDGRFFYLKPGFGYSRKSGEDDEELQASYDPIESLDYLIAELVQGDITKREYVLWDVTPKDAEPFLKRLQDRDKLQFSLFGWEIKEEKEKREDWVSKAAMLGIPVQIVKKKKENDND